jgi:protein phosphatase methylesterase 1
LFHVLQAELRAHGCRVLAMDLRGHGASSTPAELQLDAATLASDVAAVYGACVPAGRPCVLAGHSVGGAVAARACERVGAVGLVLVDVAEAAAAASFDHMETLLRARPRAFVSPAHAVRWAVAAQLPRSLASARVSVPPQLVRFADGSGDATWRWRTDVLAARGFWDGWYAGVTELFLRVRAAKLLLLAGADRLDKALTIAQMQGRFQLALLPVPTSHSVQEDAPQLTAKTMRDFAARLAALPLPRPLP